MGCTSSKSAIPTYTEREEYALGPPSKTMDASDYVQNLVMLVSRTIKVHLDVLHLGTLIATQMITRSVKEGDGCGGGVMYYVKVKLESVKDWPWIFVKIYEPPLVTDVSPVTFKGMKKMKEDYKLVTF